jgi:hypothetical protein
MAASLISYFCTMVTACIVFVAAMSHLPTPPKFRQPHPVVAFKHDRKAVEPDKLSSAQSLGTGRSSVSVAEAASQEPQNAESIAPSIAREARRSAR